jgi:hypothetical protein
MTVPYTFGNATTSIPLSNLDADFATPITLGNTNVYLGNTTTNINNLSLGNVTITSVGSTFPNSYLSNSSATLGNAVVTLGGTTTSVGNLTLTNVTISSVASTLPNSYLANSSVTINGTSVALGGSATITANAAATLTISTGLSGTSYNGGTAVTIAIDSTVATLTGVQTLTNKTINGSNNTLSNIPNSALTNNTVTVNGTSIALGASGTVTAAAGTLTGTTLNSTVVTSSLTSVGTITTGVWNGTAIGNTYLANSTISGVSLGSNLANLTAGTNISFSSGTTYNGSSAITINATASPQVYPGAGIANSTGTAWGTSYSTTGSGTVVALATSPTFVTPILGTPTSGTLTNTTGFPAANLAGTALPSAIVTSSLTALGTIATGVWNGTAIGIAYGGTGQATASAGFNALSPITTTGDLILGNGTNSATRLPIGTNGYVLTVSGGTAVWSASGSGSGTVNSGTQYQLGYYATTGTAISGNSNIVTDANGNLGLGVTPSAWASDWKVMQIGTRSSFAQYNSNASAFVLNNLYFAGSSGSNPTYINTAGASAYQQVNGIHNWYTAPSGTAGTAVSLTQAMTLDASANLFVGATALTSNANYFATSPSNAFSDFGHATGVATTTPYTRFLYAGGVIGSITQSGTTAVLYNVTSDQRLKENIQDAESASALIDSLQVREYDWKADGSHQRYGFIAQELVTVAPEAVHQPADPEEMMAVDYSKLVPMLVKEIQSLRKRILTLENK